MSSLLCNDRILAPAASGPESFLQSTPQAETTRNRQLRLSRSVQNLTRSFLSAKYQVRVVKLAVISRHSASSAVLTALYVRVYVCSRSACVLMCVEARGSHSVSSSIILHLLF